MNSTYPERWKTWGSHIETMVAHKMTGVGSLGLSTPAIYLCEVRQDAQALPPSLDPEQHSACDPGPGGSVARAQTPSPLGASAPSLPG